MAFHFVHNLIEKIKEAYNRPYEEARREKLEHQRKIWAEQGKEAKERQASDSFIHYCIKCYAYASVLPLTWEGGHMGCGGGVRGFPAVSKESFDAMSEEEKAKVKDLLAFCTEPRSRKEICEYLGMKSISYVVKEYIQPLINDGSLKLSIPEKPSSSKQKYFSVM